jgi:integrase
MFFTNRDGGPLTVHGMGSLIDSLNTRFGVFGGQFLEDQFKLYPHAIRHTVETLFKAWGIPRDVRQRHLGHKRPDTTDLYGKVYRSVYVHSLSELRKEPLWDLK